MKNENIRREALNHSVRGYRYSLWANILVGMTVSVLGGNVADAYLGSGHHPFAKAALLVLAGVVLGCRLHGQGFRIGELYGSGFAQDGPTPDEVRDYLDAQKESLREEIARLSEQSSNAQAAYREKLREYEAMN